MSRLQALEPFFRIVRHQSAVPVCLGGRALSILLNNIRLPHGNGLLSLHGFAYSLCLKPALGDYFGSLVYALLFVALNWGIGYTLYKRKIYIKI